MLMNRTLGSSLVIEGRRLVVGEQIQAASRRIPKISHESFELFLMLANANTVLIGKKVVLVPYEAEHVPVSSPLLIDLYADRE